MGFYLTDTTDTVPAIRPRTATPRLTGKTAYTPRFRGGLSQGREYSYRTGFYYFRARWYEPVTGRWLSNDPIGISGGLNQYQAFGNNSVNFTDPMGTDIAVIWNGPTAGNPLGHVAMSVTGSGVWSYYNNTKGGSSLLSYLERELPKRDSTVYVIPTTPAQDRAALAAFKKSKIGAYSAIKHNCADVVNDGLDAADIPTPTMPSATGASLSGLEMPTPFLRFDPGMTAYRAAQVAGVSTFQVPLGQPISDSVKNALKQFEP